MRASAICRPVQFGNRPLLAGCRSGANRQYIASAGYRTLFPIHYSAFDSASFVPCECTRDIVSDGSTALNLGSCPHPKLQYVLELLRQIVPSVVIAGRMRGKIVIDIVSAARAMCDDVI